MDGTDLGYDRTEVPARDPDTGAINRALLVEAATPMLSLARRYARSMAFLHIHVAGLQERVQSLGKGHQKEFLRNVTARIMAAVRDSDFVANVGAGRFVVALTEVWEPDAAVRVASRLVRTLSELSDGDTPYDPRVGVAFFPSDADSLGDLLELAREAVDRVADGQGIAFADPVLGADALQRAGLERDLLGEAETDQFLLHFQPIFGVDSGEVVGVESLLRWDHPLRGQLAAGQFIPLAERTGRVRALDQWAILEALDVCRRWHDMGWDGWISVNLSGKTLSGGRIVDYVGRAMKERGVDPRSIVFEVTENTALARNGEVVRVLQELRQLGSRIAVDDFGTGHASFEYLRDFDPDLVKLDRVFIAGGDQPRYQKLFHSLVLMVHHLGKPVVVEGLEEEAQHARLLESGADMAQGFLLGRPVGRAEFEAQYLKTSIT
jgi:diguanylate cyclase (GGDEF)-like protein